MDRETVIKAIEGCINDGSFCNECDYDGCIFQHGSCEKDLLADALELLKEQEDMGKELIDAMELVHKKNARIIELTDLLKEQEAGLQKGRYYSDVFDIGYKAGKESIVRCRDCKHRYEHDDGTSECEIKSGWFPVSPDWYCADGRKKDG